MMNRSRPIFTGMGIAGRQRDEPLTSYVRFRLQTMEREGGDKLGPRAKAAGLVPSGVNQVKNGKLGVASGTIDGYAKMLGARDRTALRADADAWWEREGKRLPPVGTRPALMVVREERYEAMPTVRDAARLDGIPEDFVGSWEAKLDFDGQPPFSMLYDLLRASWNASRGRLVSRPVTEDDF